MENKNYSASITVSKTPDEVFNSINKVSEWWTGVKGSSEKVNDVFTMSGGETWVTHKVAELIPGKKVVWEVTDCFLHFIKDKKEWNGTKMIFDIVPKGNETQVNFTHVGLVPSCECYANCEKGWDHFIKTSLFKFITEGKGQPK